jgi:TonB family protein
LRYNESMHRARSIAVTLLPPLLYALAVFVTTRKPKPVYAFADPTVITVSEKAGPAVYHAPEAVYPQQALRNRVAGSVTFKVTIAADGSVARADVVRGPVPLVAAALAAMRQYQFEAAPAEAEIEIPFSLHNPTRSFSSPEPVERRLPKSRVRGQVRLVAFVNLEGRVRSVQTVSGPAKAIPLAAEAVRQWRFRPARRNGHPIQGTIVVDVPMR